jgi:pimeloyl-[acyl-carrier protein] methyl ester esterase
MNILTLSGWAQPADAVSKALDLDAASFDFSDYATPEASFDALAAHRDVDHIVGWSTGGYLALRAIAAGVLKPKQLTLIAAPYQFVSDERFKSGMDPLTFQLFRESYAKDPARTKQRFHALVAKGDEAPKTILSQLEHHADVDNTGRWLPWLDNLHAVSLRDINLSAVPQTLIIQGAADAVVPQAQGEALLSALPKAKLELWDNTGHAPHLRDKLRLLQSLNHFA